MKRTIITLLLLLSPLLAFGQQEASDDSAAMVVDRYLQMLDLESYSTDSMLVMETAVTFYGSTDTLWLRRWFSPPRKFRMEQWHQGELVEGLISNNEDNFLRYDAQQKKWLPADKKEITDRLSGYDFRGPLYLWRWNGTKLTWNGHSELKGAPVQVVKASRPGSYDRFYMFEPGSGLLTLMVESEEYDPAGPAPKKENHVEWKSCHEYLPVGTHLVPSLESFMRDGRLTILSTTATMEYIRPRIFNRE